jgi:hypothetical protein
MNFGFTACHTSVPGIQRVAVYSADALRELEAAVLAPPPSPARGQRLGPGRRHARA